MCSQYMAWLGIIGIMQSRHRLWFHQQQQDLNALLSQSGWWCVKCALSFLALILKNLAWWNNCSLTRISFSHIYCTPNLYPFKDLFSISYFMFARAYFLGNEIFTKNANFLLLIWQNCQLIMIMWCSHMFSLLCPTFTLWPS